MTNFTSNLPLVVINTYGRSIMREPYFVPQGTNLLVASICLAAVIALLLLLTLAAVLWPVRRTAVKVGNR